MQVCFVKYCSDKPRFITVFGKFKDYGRLVENHKEMVLCRKKVMELKEIVLMRGCREVDKI